MFVRKGPLTREEIISAIQEFADEFGRPPHINDWSPDRLKWQEGHDPKVVAERLRIRALREWPTVTPVKKCFGSWNRAIAAAGFEPHPRGGGRKWHAVA